jgi:hypothetical protein
MQVPVKDARVNIGSEVILVTETKCSMKQIDPMAQFYE